MLFLAGFSPSTRRNNCTTAAEQGTARNATEAGNNRFIARRRRRSGRQHRAGIGCPGSEVVVEPGAVGNFDASTSDGNNRLRLNLRLPAHRQTTKAPGVSHCAAGDVAHHLDVHVDFSSDFSHWTIRPGSTWSTRSVLALDSIQSNLRLDRTQGIDNESNVFVEVDAQLFNALLDVVAIYGSRKCFVFQFLFD